jgi:hypothetical protein
MLWGAVASFVLAFVMAVLVGLGFWHAARTPEEARLLSPKTDTVPMVPVS